MRASERLLERLRREGVVPAGQEVTVERLHPSRAMRVQGAWSWSAWWGAGRTEETAGSQWPMSACLAAPEWNAYRNRFGEVSIDPVDEEGKLWKAR